MAACFATLHVCAHLGSGASARSNAPRQTLRQSASPSVTAPSAPSIGATQQPLVASKYGGVLAPKLEQVFTTELPGLQEALAGVAADVSPAAAAQLCRHLDSELPHTLTDAAHDGDCALVAIAPGLLALLESTAEWCEQAVRRGEPSEAAANAKALLSLLGRLRFSSRASAAGYADVAMRCKLALKAAYDAGADIHQEDIVELEAACARSSPWLWLTPYFGHRCAASVDEFISQGWASGELAVRFTEAYCSLTGRGRYTQVASKFVRLVRAALKHQLSADQLRRLLGAAHRLPIDMRLELEIHSRSDPADCWYADIDRRLIELEAEPAAGATGASSPASHKAHADVFNGAVPAAVGRHTAPRANTGRRDA